VYQGKVYKGDFSMLNSEHGAWSAQTIDRHQWMIIDMGSVRSITGVVTQCRSNFCTSQRVETFCIEVSTDGKFFTPVPNPLHQASSVVSLEAKADSSSSSSSSLSSSSSVKTPKPGKESKVEGATTVPANTASPDSKKLPPSSDSLKACYDAFGTFIRTAGELIKDSSTRELFPNELAPFYKQHPEFKELLRKAKGDICESHHEASKIRITFEESVTKPGSKCYKVSPIKPPSKSASVEVGGKKIPRSKMEEASGIAFTACASVEETKALEEDLLHFDFDFGEEPVATNSSALIPSSASSASHAGAGATGTCTNSTVSSTNYYVEDFLTGSPHCCYERDDNGYSNDGCVAHWRDQGIADDSDEFEEVDPEDDSEDETA
jgi:hypothetical protein